MEVQTSQTREIQALHKLMKPTEPALFYYASEAAREMEFQDVTEFQEALKRAMELCIHAEISLEQNFKRIYKSTYNGIVSDLKLSDLAYRLVCVNGKTSNPSVARLQIELLLKNIK